jgi:diguanylate cyclase (GGDEF)-like protein
MRHRASLRLTRPADLAAGEPDRRGAVWARGSFRVRAEAWRVWLFTVVLSVIAVSGYGWFIRDMEHLASPFRLPWPLLAGAFLAVETRVIVVHFRRESHSFSLSEFPAVAGLFFVAPAEYILAVLAGSGAALLLARQSPLKLAFNLANFALNAVMQLVVFREIASLGRMGAITSPGILEWLAAFCATIMACVLGAATIATAISLSGGAPQFQKLPDMLRFGAIVALANTSLALLAVSIMWIDPIGLWLFVIPLGALFFAYRAYVSEREKHERLELLYKSSRILQHSPEIDSALVALLDHAREMFHAEVAEIVVFPHSDDDRGLRTTSAHGATAEVMAPIVQSSDDPLRVRLATERHAFLLRSREVTERAGRPIRDGIISPLLGESGLIGSMMVANRRTEGTSFDRDDLQLLETIANQAAVALENGQLEQSLAELSRLKEQLRHQAYHDVVTGLANRSMFVEQLDRQLALVEAGRVVAVLFLDLDDFKLVNDTLGHAAGDHLLAVVAERLRSCVRAEDLVARLGGDEFAILVVDDECLERARAIADRIIDALRVSFPVQGQDLIVAGSIGIAAGRWAGELSGDLLRNADLAMYTAKSAGKRRVAVFDPTMHTAIVAHHALSVDLSMSVERRELSLHYQPIIELATGRVAGVEALARWRHPGRGIVAPDVFIPLAEETGTILPLGRWVLREACLQAAEWLRVPGIPATFSMSVNVSPLQLQRPDFIAEVEMALAAADLPSGRLILEMTETAMFLDTKTTISKLQALRKRGVRIAMDDFGTGYSSLGYLNRFPVDILKIAREFVVPADRDPGEWAFAHAIVALGHTLGLQIVAEGIEERGQVERLVGLGCQLGQGYHLGRPGEPSAVGSTLCVGEAFVAREAADDKVVPIFSRSRRRDPSRRGAAGTNPETDSAEAAH